MAFFVSLRRVVSTGFGVACVASLAMAGVAGAQGRTVLPQAQTVSLLGADAGAVPNSQSVPSIVVTLKRSAAQQASLDSFLTDVRTKGSASYHQWLTPAQFAQQFAPTTNSVAQVTTWLQTQGLQVSAVDAGGMRLTVSGTAAQADAAFNVSLHRMAMTLGGDAVTVQGTPSVPDALANAVQSVSGLDTTATVVSSVAALADAVNANTTAVLTADLSTATVSQDELKRVLEQAAAQGQTVLLTGASSTLLPERAFLVVKGAAASDAADEGETMRPDWQAAQGLPADDLRAMPDAAVTDVTALAVGLTTVATKSGRQGEIAARIYQVAPEPGVFTHADASVADGTWAQTDGLGTVNVQALVKALAVGTTAPDSSAISLSSHNVTHGQPITLTATINGSSGTPTGTVTFATSQDGTLGTSNLAAASSGSATATFTTSTLPGGQHGFYGTYSGDSTYAASTTNVDTGTVGTETAAVSGAVSGSTAVGTNMSVVVTVKSPSGVGTPSGTVTAYAYGTALGQTAFTGTLATQTTGTATTTISIPATNAGTYTFQANCTTDASFLCATPGSFSVTETKGAPLFTLTQTGTSSAATLTAKVTAPSGAASTVIAPIGTITFLDNGTSIGTGTLASGVATYSGALGSGTTHVVTASYAGDSNYNTATATANAVTKVTPTVVLAVVTAGTSLSATVTPPSGTTTIPTGTVQFLLGTTAVGTGTLNASGVATYTGTYGSGILTAVYAGDTNFTTATSNAIDTTKVTPTVTLTNSSTATDGTVALSAAVTSTSATVATGTMKFLDGTTQIGTGTLSASGVATFAGSVSTTVTSSARVRPFATTATVAHTLTAVYSGDTNFNTATSNAVTANVTTTLISTTTALTSSSGTTGSYGTSFTFNAVVTPASYVASGAAPSGTVTLSDASGVVGTGTLSSGTATITLSTLSVGTHALTATYGGDTNYAASTSSALTVTITAVTATLAATISPTGSVPYGYNATLNITATVASGTAPSGTVTAVISGNNGTYTATLAGATGATSSTASISFPVPPPGTYTITVTCAAGMTCNTATVRLTTTKGYTTTTITGLPTAPQAGVPTTITATVANSGTGTGTYTYSGTISFYAGNKYLGKGTVANGTATATITFTSAAAQSVTAIYSGDTNWNGSTSTAVTVTPLPLDATVTVTPSTTNGIVGQNITLTASAVSSVTGATLVPSGTVTFYDTYNNVVVNLGSAALLSNGLNASYATLNTTGLRAGVHSIIAVYGGDTAFNNETSAAATVTMGDFSMSFVPSSVTIAQGGTGQTTLVVTGVSGYAGSVALGCTPPGGSLTTCTISPSSVTAGSTALITITTTKTTTTSSSRVALGASAAGLIALLLAGGRRRRVAALLVVLLAVGLMAGGCAEDSTTNNGGGGGTTNNGTPLGTMTFQVTGAAVNAPVAAQRTAAFSVTVQ